MKFYTLLLVLVGSLAAAQEIEEDEPYVSQLSDEETRAFEAAVREVQATMSEEDMLRPYVVLYKHADRTTPRQILFLDGAASVDLSRNCQKFANEISQIIISAPSHLSLTFYDRYGRPSRPMRSGTWWGVGEGLTQWVSQYDLKVLGLHDTIVWFEVKHDGIKPNTEVQWPICN